LKAVDIAHRLEGLPLRFEGLFQTLERNQESKESGLQVVLPNLAEAPDQAQEEEGNSADGLMAAVSAGGHTSHA
jgi:hypothetical protein